MVFSIQDKVTKTYVANSWTTLFPKEEDDGMFHCQSKYITKKATSFKQRKLHKQTALIPSKQNTCPRKIKHYWGLGNRGIYIIEFKNNGRGRTPLNFWSWPMKWRPCPKKDFDFSMDFLITHVAERFFSSKIFGINYLKWLK